MGGKVAMQLALEHPDDVRALVALDIAPRTYEPSHVALMEALQSLDLSSISSRSEADEALAYDIPSKPVRAFLLTNLVKDGESYRWRLNLDALRADYENILSWQGKGSYDGPALFLGGDRSKYLQEERDGELVGEHFPSATIKIIEEAGHWLHSDQPDEVREHLTAFLTALSA
jgi:esterase